MVMRAAVAGLVSTTAGQLDRFQRSVATCNCYMKNDTAIFDAMRPAADAGEASWTGLTGTREAIERDGFAVDPATLTWCPHEWINKRGYLDLALVQKHPRRLDA